jgi:hypothetical protein
MYFLVFFFWYLLSILDWHTKTKKNKKWMILSLPKYWKTDGIPLSFPFSSHPYLFISLLFHFYLALFCFYIALFHFISLLYRFISLLYHFISLLFWFIFALFRYISIVYHFYFVFILLLYHCYFTLISFLFGFYFCIFYFVFISLLYSHSPSLSFLSLSLFFSLSFFYNQPSITITSLSSFDLIFTCLQSYQQEELSRAKWASTRDYLNGHTDRHQVPIQKHNIKSQDQKVIINHCVI